MLTIYGRDNSSNVRKVLWACAEMSIPHERLDYGRGFKSGESPEHLALNPNGTVPTIVEGDFVLWESNSIIRYLVRENSRDDLLPRDTKQCAIVEQWMDWQIAALAPQIFPIFTFQVVGNQALGDPDMQAQQKKRVNRLMGILNEQIGKSGAYVAGDGFTAADFPAGMFTHRYFSLDIDRPQLTALQEYYERLQQRQTYRDVIVAGGP